MNRSLLLPGAYLLDQLVGDPEWFPHPVRMIGSVISSGEALLRTPGQSDTSELLAGSLLTIAVVGSSYFFTAAILQLANRSSPLLGAGIEVGLAWTCLAARNLEQEATAITHALEAGDLVKARIQLARIVGRDTQTLDSHDISRAVIETVAESASDGVLAPLFYMALGGVPLAMAYKAANTLDSMIGHADSRYLYFGRSAARLDDAANLLPSRVSALAIVAAAAICKDATHQAAWRTWLRDGSKHKSPNAGQPEAAMAGALEVTLGGDNTYAGERISTPHMGEEFFPPSEADARRAICLVSAASLIGLGLGIALAGLLATRKRG